MESHALNKSKPRPLTDSERMRWIRLFIRRVSYKHKLHAPNTTMVLNWEADMLSVTSGGFIHEYEIKTNRKDYVKDYSKYKHGYFRQAFSGEKPQRVVPAWMKEWHARGQYTDEYMENYRNVPLNYLPNYFWFVCVDFPIEAREIPEYAGVMIVESVSSSEYGENPYYSKIVRPAPRLHKEKITDKQMLRLLTAMHWRYWKWAEGAGG